MRRRFLAPFAIAITTTLAWTIVPASAEDLWLHVRVEEGGESPEKVKVNIPLSLVEDVLPLIRTEELREGRVRVPSEELEGVDVRAIWEAVRKTRDAEFVTVEGPDENVRVAKDGDFLVVHVIESGEDAETVDVRVPLAVVDALFSAGPDELDVLAAIRVLGEHSGHDLVTVKGPDSHVRIWVDAVGSER